MKHFVILLSLFSLTACSTYQEHFECPVGEGVRCASLSTINQKMDKNEIQLEDISPEANTPYFGPDFRVGGGF